MDKFDLLVSTPLLFDLVLQLVDLLMYLLHLLGTFKSVTSLVAEDSNAPFECSNVVQDIFFVYDVTKFTACLYSNLPFDSCRNRLQQLSRSPLLGMAAASDQLAVWKCYQTVSAGGFRKVLRDGPPSQSAQAGISEGDNREQARVVAHRQAKVDWPCPRSTVICCAFALSSLPAPVILRFWPYS